MRVAIHQCNFMPWSGFFRKMALCDTFVILDDVQYEKNGYTNRVKIRTKRGLEWLTVPVHHKSDTLIRDVKIDYSDGKKYTNILNKIYENYKDAKNFTNVWESLQRMHDLEPEYLWTLNMHFIFLFKEILKISADIVFSSDLDIKTKGSDRILDICRLLNADVYVTGTGSQTYLETDHFANNDIDITWLDSNVQHKPYQQQFEPFISGSSELDYIMNELEI